MSMAGSGAVYNDGTWLYKAAKSEWLHALEVGDEREVVVTWCRMMRFYLAQPNSALPTRFQRRRPHLNVDATDEQIYDDDDLEADVEADGEADDSGATGVSS